MSAVTSTRQVEGEGAVRVPAAIGSATTLIAAAQTPTTSCQSPGIAQLQRTRGKERARAEARTVAREVLALCNHLARERTTITFRTTTHIT
eukprot:1816109-Rhodomonas_salina.1